MGVVVRRPGGHWARRPGKVGAARELPCHGGHWCAAWHRSNNVYLSSGEEVHADAEEGEKYGPHIDDLERLQRSSGTFCATSDWRLYEQQGFGRDSWCGHEVASFQQMPVYCLIPLERASPKGQQALTTSVG